jgi:pimeloyl-ACP methyl ester carboxylesterase
MERTLFAPPARGAVLLCLCLAAGCASAPPRLPPTPPPSGPVTGVVFCADGAGGFGYTTETLTQTVAQERLGLRVVYVPWSHGTGRMFADNGDWCNVRTQARQLASEVRSLRERDPALPIYLVGHSAGCAVLLEATTELPPASVERIVLLAPSVSPDYDLRPALAASRCGIDAFLSSADWVTLGLGMRLFGTTDRRWTAAAGKVGFRRPADPSAACLYARLREHFWEPSDACTGHRGGHYGSYEPAFLRSRVLPLLRTEARAPRGGP